MSDEERQLLKKLLKLEVKWREIQLENIDRETRALNKLIKAKEELAKMRGETVE